MRSLSVLVVGLLGNLWKNATVPPHPPLRCAYSVYIVFSSIYKAELTFGFQKWCSALDPH